MCKKEENKGGKYIDKFVNVHNNQPKYITLKAFIKNNFIRGILRNVCPMFISALLITLQISTTRVQIHITLTIPTCEALRKERRKNNTIKERKCENKKDIQRRLNRSEIKRKLY